MWLAELGQWPTNLTSPLPGGFTEFSIRAYCAHSGYQDGRPTTIAAGEDDVEPEDDEPYDVEKLLRWRWRGPSQRRVKEYLVLWTGWSIDDASLVPEENFDYPEELEKMVAHDRPIEDSS